MDPLPVYPPWFVDFRLCQFSIFNDSIDLFCFLKLRLLLTAPAMMLCTMKRPTGKAAPGAWPCRSAIALRAAWTCQPQHPKRCAKRSMTSVRGRPLMSCNSRRHVKIFCAQRLSCPDGNLSAD